MGGTAFARFFHAGPMSHLHFRGLFPEACDPKNSIPIENFNLDLEIFNLDLEFSISIQNFQSRGVSIYGALLLLQRRSQSKF